MEEELEPPRCGLGVGGATTPFPEAGTPVAVGLVGSLAGCLVSGSPWLDSTGEIEPLEDPESESGLVRGGDVAPIMCVVFLFTVLEALIFPGFKSWFNFSQTSTSLESAPLLFGSSWKGKR